MDEICAVCGRTFQCLQKHLFKHGLSYEQYLVEYKLDGTRPVCSCGCGQYIAFRKGVFMRFRPGHQCRDPEVRAVMISSGISAANDPEKRKKNSDSLKKKWQDPEFRDRLLKKLEETKEERHRLINEAWKDESRRELMRQKTSERWNNPEWATMMREKMSSSEFKDSVSCATKNALDDPDIRLILSRHASQMVEDGLIGSTKSNRTEVVDPFTGRTVQLHSSWEREFFESAKKNGVLLCRDHKIRVQYTDENGRTRMYIPDFFDPMRCVLYEIKGHRTIRDDFKEKATLELSASLGWSYILISNKQTASTYFNRANEVPNG